MGRWRYVSLLAGTRLLDRFSEQLPQPLGRGEPIGPLRAKLLGNDPQYALFVRACRQSPKYPPFLRIGKSATIGHIEKQRHPRIDLINILPAGAATARGLENDIGFVNFNVTGNWYHSTALPSTSFRLAVKLIKIAEIGNNLYGTGIPYLGPCFTVRFALYLKVH